MKETYSALFLCTGNSARSILGEALLRQLGQGRFTAYSAGSHPAGQVNPLALELLAKNGLPTAGLRSKNWSEFEGRDAPRMDFIFTVCDSAAAETCPVWPGHPMTAHWGVPDPAAVEGSGGEKRKAFMAAFAVLRRRVSLLVSLPLGRLDELALKSRLAEIGRE